MNDIGHQLCQGNCCQKLFSHFKNIHTVWSHLAFIKIVIALTTNHPGDTTLFMQQSAILKIP